MQSDSPSQSRTQYLAIAVTSGAALCAWSGPVQAEDLRATVESAAVCFLEAPDDTTKQIVRDCGYLVLPENPSLPDGRSVRLGYLRLGDPATTPQKPPLFMLAGGPGETLLTGSIFQLFNPALMGGILKERDVILVEQRGGLHSEPRLGCPEASLVEAYGMRDGRSPDDILAAEAAAYAACAKAATDAGIDLTQYNSLALAADVDMARQAFGFDRIALYGESYGTMVAQDFIKTYPGVAEAVILDGTDPLSSPSWTRHRGVAADGALRNLDSLCSGNAKCDAAYDLMTMMQAGIDMFDQGPLNSSYTDPADPANSVSFDIYAEHFVGFIHSQMTGRIQNASIPAIVQQATAGGPEAMIAVLSPLIGPELLSDPPPEALEQFTNLMHMVVVCSDDPPNGSDDVNLPDGITEFGRLIGQNVARQYHANCSALALPKLPDETDENPTDSVPLLALAGGLDVRTPTANIATLKASMPQMQLVEFPSGSHVQLGEINRCAAAIMTAFLSDPGRPVETACVAQMPFLGFVLPDGTMTGE